MTKPFSVALVALISFAFASASLSPAVSFAEEPMAAPSWSNADEAIPEQGKQLTGREIYENFLDNKFMQSFQILRVISRDPGGSEQQTHFELSLEDTRDANKNPVDGVKAKTLVEVTAPFDMRHTAYLMITKDPGPDDEFAYQPSQRRVKRVDLKNTSLFGTDYTFNDIAFQNIDDAEYLRHPDEAVEGIPVYVVEANLKREIDVEFHRTLTYMETEHYVPLRTRYWDDFGIEVKELTAPHAKIRSFDDTWVATESTMKDLLQKTDSTLYVESLDTNPKFARHTFAASRLSRAARKASFCSGKFSTTEMSWPSSR